MALEFSDLTSETRTQMLSEVERDTDDGVLYISSRLNDEGREEYPRLLREAVQEHNEDWLGKQILSNGLLKLVEEKKDRYGGITTAKIPRTAHETLAQGEFNRFYIRGVCLRAIAEGRQVEVYRARYSANPRYESQELIGTHPEPEKLLFDLRINQGVDTVLGLPPGPNSGLTIKLV